MSDTATVYLVRPDEAGHAGWGSRVKVEIAATEAADAAAAAFLHRATRYVVGEPYNVFGEAFGEFGPATQEVLFPTCEHGMNLHNCYGPDHFPSAAQEREWGW